jgi:Family of unknown function (DUF6776)
MSRRAGEKGRPALIYVLGGALLVASIYLAFELGRYEGGYSVIDERRERTAADEALAERDANIEDLRRQIAVLETSREIDKETYAQVEANLSQLQAKIQAQEEELAFYRGIVSPQDGISGLRIQNFEVVPGDAEQRYIVRLVLVQGIIHNQRVSGVVKLHVSGSQDGAPVALDLADVATGPDTAEMAYRFRYFQGFEREVTLPVGFEPSSIEVEIMPSEPRGEPVKQSFSWSDLTG